jgi:N-acetylglucosamine-6-phosphate deacetylase
VNKDIPLVDLHIHGIGNFDTTSTDSEDILDIARIEKKNGIAKMVLSVYPNDIKSMRKQFENIRQAMENIKNTNMKACTSIEGIHIEGPFLNPAKAGALDKKYLLPPSVESLKAIIDGYEDIIRIITIAPELRNSTDVIKFCRDAGMKVNMGHSDATFREADKGKNAGATGITHLFNAMRPFHHREPGLAGFGLLDKDTYIEIIADGVHLDIKTLELVFSIKPPEKIVIISDTVKGCRSGKSAVYLKDGTIAGSCITLSESIDLLIENGFDPDTVRMAASSNPLRYIS